VAIGDGPELEHREVRSPGESRARACPGCDLPKSAKSDRCSLSVWVPVI